MVNFLQVVLLNERSALHSTDTHLDAHNHDRVIGKSKTFHAESAQEQDYLYAKLPRFVQCNVIELSYVYTG